MSGKAGQCEDGRSAFVEVPQDRVARSKPDVNQGTGAMRPNLAAGFI
jgi:hypothetical protein